MDAKPQRPPRSFLPSAAHDENAPPAAQSLHQRHKSAGNLKIMAANGAAKGGIRRAVFADVSNAGRVQPVEVKSAAPALVVGKENTSQAKAAFLQPAQRPKNYASVADLRSFHHAREAEADPKAMNGPAIIDARAPVPPKHAGVKRTMVYHDAESYQEQQSQPVEKKQPVPKAQDRKSPRQYKSQPHLKTDQPVLRRTQSRVLIEQQKAQMPVIFREEDGANTPYVDAVEDVRLLDWAAREIDDKDLNLHADLYDIDPHALEVLRKDLDLVATSKPRAESVIEPASHPQHGVPASALSEAEEYWDEDEEFYDDQGYTTAHSYRSLGENTTGGATTVIIPKVTVKIQKELDNSRILVESQITQEELDEEAWDVSMVAEYGDEIFDYMKQLETKMLPDSHYMDNQTEIQWSMRSVLMEWLVQVHHRFGLLPETLFLTVNYIDRFLTSKIVSVGKLQLVGATAIFIAAKYEEINCPSIQEIVYMVDGTYSSDEILKAERFMLSMLSFELGWPGPMSFLRRISKADEYDLETRTLAKYFLEVTIMDERFVGSPPSFLAAGAHCLARLMLGKGDWSPAHTHYSGYTWSQIKHLTAMILDCCQSPRIHHAAVYEKYADRRFKKASVFVEEEVRKGFSLTFQQAPLRFSLPNLLEDSSIAQQYVSRDTGLMIPIEG